MPWGWRWTCGRRARRFQRRYKPIVRRGERCRARIRRRHRGQRSTVDERPRTTRRPVRLTRLDPCRRLSPSCIITMSSPGPGPPREAKFWLPPPPQAAALPAIRASLPSFPSPPLRISRVGQLDGALLDQELEGILGGPLWKALEGIRVRLGSRGSTSRPLTGERRIHRVRGDGAGSQRSRPS